MDDTNPGSGCQKAAPLPSDDLDRCSDGELLAILRTGPGDSRQRDKARDLLVSHYRHLVVACVRRYANSPEPTEDLMQTGYVGLLNAVNNFDPAYGNGLAAYALPSISGELKRHFRDKRWQVRVERPVQELALQVRRAGPQLAQRLGHAPGDGELAAYLGRSMADIRRARAAVQVLTAMSSLDAPAVIP
jgi:RNA polymerase sigma-B factor